jgi:hypothetical protein
MMRLLGMEPGFDLRRQCCLLVMVGLVSRAWKCVASGCSCTSLRFISWWRRRPEEMKFPEGLWCGLGADTWVSLVACLIGCGRSGSGIGSEVFGPGHFIDSDLAGLSILFNTEGVFLTRGTYFAYY